MRARIRGSMMTLGQFVSTGARIGMNAPSIDASIIARSPWRLGASCVALYCLLCTSRASAQATDTIPSSSELKRLSVEQLMEIEVTSVSKKTEKLSQAASAIQVITREQILRSGATSIPEALRLAPNLQVAKVGSHRWAITARGFNSATANKLLVLIDGRSVYTPLFSGVFWDVQNVLLEDIDRIEVVSGPGGAVWGANAVNGVINIITKNASDTTGGLIVGEAGNYDRGTVGVRYGISLGEWGAVRVYGKYF